MGTHARSGLARAFLGSTTEGVLRMTEAPVLAVRAGTRAGREGKLFGRAVVAVDDSDPADAAVSLAGRLRESLHTDLVPCMAVDTRHLYDMAFQYGYDATPFRGEMYAHARSVVEQSMLRARLEIPSEVAVVEGEPVVAILQASEQHHADFLIIGSHGRRGLRRLVLGSVAEHVVRRSPIPVLVVRR